MIRVSFVCLLVLNAVATIAAELPGQAPVAKSDSRGRFNQVYVKVIVPITPQTAKQDGPVVESWVAEELERMGESEFFAVTDWVPVCDALLEDDVVDNRVRLKGKLPYCPVGGDILERENGRLLVAVGGFTPGGGEANIRLRDEAGSRAVGPVRLLVGKTGKRTKIEEGLPYVAVLIAPPPRNLNMSRGNTEQSPQGKAK